MSCKNDYICNMTKEEKRRYEREWYQKNKEKKKAANARWEQKQMDKFKALKKTLKCEKCDENHPACLEFHHDDPNTKEGLVGQLARSWSSERLENEIKKCTVLCANCHRKLHNPE